MTAATGGSRADGFGIHMCRRRRRLQEQLGRRRRRWRRRRVYKAGKICRLRRKGVCARGHVERNLTQTREREGELGSHLSFIIFFQVMLRCHGRRWPDGACSGHTVGSHFKIRELYQLVSLIIFTDRHEDAWIYLFCCERRQCSSLSCRVSRCVCGVRAC